MNKKSNFYENQQLEYRALASRTNSDHLLKCNYDSLKLFQELLRTNPELNKRFHGKAEAIAAGLQPWLDALEVFLNKRVG